MNRLIVLGAVFVSVGLFLGILTWQQTYLLKSSSLFREAPLSITTAPILLEEEEFVVMSPRPLAECQAERRACGEDCGTDDPLIIDGLCDTECEAEQELCLQVAQPAEASSAAKTL